MEESLRVKEFEQIISTEEFDSQIEPLNIPAVNFQKHNQFIMPRSLGLCF